MMAKSVRNKKMYGRGHEMMVKSVRTFGKSPKVAKEGERAEGEESYPDLKELS